MSRRDKLVERFKDKPKDFAWDELVRLLSGCGYTEKPRGKTSGSRRHFSRGTSPTITVHRPHPGNIVRMYSINDVLLALTKEGLI